MTARDKHPNAKARGVITMTKRMQNKASEIPICYCIYFVRDTTRPRIKIGFSGCPLVRIKELSRKERVPLRLLALEFGGREKERVLHERFSSTALGHEWFRPSKAMKQYIAGISGQ